MTIKAPSEWSDKTTNAGETALISGGFGSFLDEQLEAARRVKATQHQTYARLFAEGDMADTASDRRQRRVQRLIGIK